VAIDIRYVTDWLPAFNESLLTYCAPQSTMSNTSMHLVGLRTLMDLGRNSGSSMPKRCGKANRALCVGSGCRSEFHMGECTFKEVSRTMNR
jgi:hypothetical protein